LVTRIHDLKYDKTYGNLWIATKGKGLLMKTQDTLIQITTKDGLVDNSLTSLFLDENDLWIGTSNGGVSRLDVRNANHKYFTFRNYTTNNGLISDRINKVVVGNNMVYLATNEGLCYFDKRKAMPNQTPPPIYLTGIKINERDTSLLKYYKLPYNKNNITISFVGLSYKQAGKIKYTYKMEGVDSNWISAEARTARFPILPPGTYSFEVKAMNNDRVTSLRPAKVNFIIEKPIWLTVWFLSIMVILFFSICYVILNAINRAKLREQKKHHLMETNMNKYRQKALSAQMNPHFIFNSLNTVQKYVLENDRDTSNIYLSKISQLMRMVLHNSQYLEITLLEELEALKLYIEVEQIRFSYNFKFKLWLHDDVNLAKIKFLRL